MEEPLTLNQIGCQFEVRSSPEKSACHSRSPSQSSSSSECHGSFRFSDADLQFRSSYADEIFHNGKILPLHPHPSQPFQAITLYADFPYVETIDVHELDLEHYAGSAPNSPSVTHTHHDYHHHTSPSPHHGAFEPARATLHPHRHAPQPQYSQSIEPARASLSRSVAATTSSNVVYKRAFSLRRVCHVNEDEFFCPLSKEALSPTRTQKSINSTTHLSYIGSTHSDFSPTTKYTSQGGGSAKSISQKEPFTKGKKLPKQGKKLQLAQSVQHPLRSPPRGDDAFFVHSPPSPHVTHYKAQRSHKESLKKKTFLPYRQGLLACIGY